MTIVRIPLAKGKGIFLVDEADVPIVSCYSWSLANASGKLYAMTRTPREGGGQRTLFAHRLIMDAQQHEEVDHRDSNGLNNTRANLRKATRKQNGANRKLSKNNTSGYKGVSWAKQALKWYAAIQCNGKSRNLGFYENVEDAARAYDAAARELFGDFARTNFPLPDEGLPPRTIEMRDLTAAEATNKRRAARSSSGIRNVFRHTVTGHYIVKFSVKGVNRHCGYFRTLEEAREVAERVRIELGR